MSYEQVQKAAKNHSLSLENRERLSLSGVEDVAGFDENLVLLSTCRGELSIRGENLHIDRIDLEAGQLELRGLVQELSYEEPRPAASFFSRLFG